MPFQMAPSPSPAPAAPSSAPAPQVLVVDDDPALRELVTGYLAEHGLRVSAACDGAGLAQCLQQDPSIELLLLDLRLPGEDGLKIAQGLRTSHPRLPIIVLTGLAEEADRVMALELGADDYVTKPFSNRELLARVRAVLRRSRLTAQSAGAPPREEASSASPRAGGPQALRGYRFGDWSLRVGTRRLHASDGREMPLSNGEFSLLMAFCQAPQRILGREQLLAMSRLHEAEVYDRAIDVQILRLRRRIETDPSHPQIIVTERGAGYRLALPVEPF